MAARRCRAGALFGMFAAVREGVGAGVLPCFLGAADERIVRRGEPIPERASELWLLSHPDLCGVGRMRVFTDFAAQALRHAD